MAIAVSTFYAPRASVDGFQSANPTSPIVGKHTSSFKFPLFSTYAGQVYDGLSHKRRQFRSLLAKDGIESQTWDSQRVLPKHVVQVPPVPNSQVTDTQVIEIGKDIRPQSPFRKWMISIQKRNRYNPPMSRPSSRNLPDWLWDTEDDDNTPPPNYSARAKSSSSSSFKFVSAVRSASISLTGFSTITRSRANTAISKCASQADHTTDLPTMGSRQSEDIAIDRSTPLSPAALDRALKRRRILEELVHTEQDYINDIRLLSNVYVTMLVSLPSTYPGLRKSVNLNLSEILQLHEEYLSELQRVVLYSEYKETGDSRSAIGTGRQLLQERTNTSSRATGINIHRGRLITDASEVGTEPQVIVEVSKIFERKMSRFFIYKEYGAKYEMMIQEAASVYDTLPDWDWNQRGLEALSALLSTRSCAQYSTNRAATMKDLLVKNMPVPFNIWRTSKIYASCRLSERTHGS
ncbi:RSP protein [Metarhizium rileyi]|uniref:RSP protein n=1 Tax=Metarhizium rileyi (strain RCEF 4871) TaxID=1649241 RepID=A0A167FMP9_METRR|nr:RSP protein [Metarhizium rileyi RCEF 4871]